MSQRRANPEAEIHSIIAGRWSPRAFAADRPVDPDALTACLEAARWAPSCFGDEPWRVVVCDRAVDAAPWQALLDCLVPKNRQWAACAPVLILMSAAKSFRNGRPNRWGEYDTGQAAMSLCLQATALGLASHQMGGFDADAAREAFSIPAGFTPMAVIALGHAGDADALDEDLMASETAERRRRPLAACFGRGRWPEETDAT